MFYVPKKKVKNKNKKKVTIFPISLKSWNIYLLREIRIPIPRNNIKKNFFVTVWEIERLSFFLVITTFNTFLGLVIRQQMIKIC